MLPNMAAGLGSIIFAIPIDADYLNTNSRAVDIPVAAVAPPIVTHPSLPSIPLSSLTTPSQAIFDPNNVRSRVAATAEGKDDDVVAVSATEKKKKRKKKSPRLSPRSTSPFRPASATPESDMNHHPGDEAEGEEGGGANTGKLDTGGVTSNLVESHSSSSSRLSLNSTNEEGQTPTFVVLDTQDNVSEAQAAVDSMAVLLSATGSQLGVSGGVVSSQSPPIDNGGGMSQEEMREAMLALVKAKDNLEERNRYYVCLQHCGVNVFSVYHHMS